jgi:hypothetical protein
MALSKSFHEVSINGRNIPVIRATTTDDASGLVTCTVYTLNHGTRQEVIRMDGQGIVREQEAVTHGSYVTVKGRKGQKIIRAVDVTKHASLHAALRDLR